MVADATLSVIIEPKDSGLQLKGVVLEGSAAGKERVLYSIEDFLHSQSSYQLTIPINQATFANVFYEEKEQAKVSTKVLRFPILPSKTLKASDLSKNIDQLALVDSYQRMIKDTQNAQRQNYLSEHHQNIEANKVLLAKIEQTIRDVSQEIIKRQQQSQSLQSVIQGYFTSLIQ